MSFLIILVIYSVETFCSVAGLVDKVVVFVVFGDADGVLEAVVVVVDRLVVDRLVVVVVVVVD